MIEIKDVEKFKKNYKMYNLYSNLLLYLCALTIFTVAFVFVQSIKGVTEIFTEITFLISLGIILSLIGCIIMRSWYQKNMDKIIEESKEATLGEEEN